jgi:hypothetical protein
VCDAHPLNAVEMMKEHSTQIVFWNSAHWSADRTTMSDPDSAWLVGFFLGDVACDELNYSYNVKAGRSDQ